jgi:methyl-accepting chemotaxis protein
MAIVVDIISEFSDRGVKSAKDAFNDFKTRVGAAEGAMGKFKAGSNAAIDAVKANAANFAMAGGAAFATFAAHGIKAFEDLALKAGELHDKTGIAVDQISRYVEVADDWGINVDSVATAVGKMNTNIGSNPNLVKNLGDDIKYTDDNTLDVNETFLNLIDRLHGIKDPAERAKEATKLFGKSWKDIAPLIEMGADRVKSALNGVSDAKVINQDELDKARKFRDAMDNLKDKVEEVALEIGGALVPQVTALVDAFLPILNWKIGDSPLITTLSSNNLIGPGYFLDQARDGFEQLTKAIDPSSTAFERASGWIDITADAFTFGLAPSIGNTVAGWLGMKDATEKVEATIGPATNRIGGYMDTVATSIGHVADEAQKVADELQAMKDKWDALTADINQDISINNLELELGKVKDAAFKAFGGGKEDFLNYKNEIDNARLKVIELAQELDLQDQRTLKIYVDKSDIEGAVGYLKALNTLGIGFGGEKTNQFGRLVAGARATGGAVSAGGTYLVGERGPELLTIGSGGRVTPNGGMSGDTINVTVMSADPNEVVRALQAYNRNVGRIPIKVQ